MKLFRIESKAGVDFGVYPGETAQEAFDAMLADAGAVDSVLSEDGKPVAGTIEDWIVREVRM
jgi:hypothetical protein